MVASTLQISSFWCLISEAVHAHSNSHSHSGALLRRAELHSVGVEEASRGSFMLGGRSAPQGCIDIPGLPLDVDQILETAHHSKSEYFKYLADHGINSDIDVAAHGAELLDMSCFAQERPTVMFFGDSVIGQTQAQMKGALALYEQWCYFSEKWPAIGTNIIKYVEEQRGKTIPTDKKLVVWASCGLHSTSKNVDSNGTWWSATSREAALREFILEFKRRLPNDQLVWESVPKVDKPLMLAYPPKPDQDWYQTSDVILPQLAEVDRRITGELGVPYADRYNIESTFRGLQCDGIHAIPNGMPPNITCPQFPVLDKLVVQSGLYSLCKKQPVPLC